MDEVLKKKVENRQHNILTNEDLKGFDYIKCGTYSGAIRWADRTYMKEQQALHYKRKKEGKSMKCVEDGVRISWNKGLTKESDERLDMSWNKGKTNVYSEETLQKMSEKKMGSKPWNTGLTRKTDDRIPECWNKGLTIETDERVKESIEHLRETNVGRLPWNTGLTKETDERLKKSGQLISETNKGRTVWNKGIMKEDDIRMRKMSEHRHIYLDRKILIEKYIIEEKSFETIAKEIGVSRPTISKEMKRLEIPVRTQTENLKLSWANVESRNKRIRNVMKAVGTNSPTSYEQKVIDLCNEFDFPFKFIGDGREIIEGKVPDFIASDGRKMIIECYCFMWHDDDYEKTRADFFKQRGYETLFLSDNDLNIKDWRIICKDKIEKFVKVKK